MPRGGGVNTKLTHTDDGTDSIDRIKRRIKVELLLDIAAEHQAVTSLMHLL